MDARSGLISPWDSHTVYKLPQLHCHGQDVTGAWLNHGLVLAGPSSWLLLYRARRMQMLPRLRRKASSGKKKKACSCAKPPPDMTCPDQSCCPTGKRISFRSRGPSSVPELTEELQGLEREWSSAVLVESRSARRRWLWLPQKEAWRSVHLAKVGAGQRVGFSEPIPNSLFSIFLPVASTQVR